MKTIFCLLLLALPAGDFCECGGCAGIAHRERVGVCALCKGGNLTIDDKICALCAPKLLACMHCGKALKDAAAVIGELSLVDKQPRPDLTYYVGRVEGGKPLGIYAHPKWFPVAGLMGRGLAWVSRDAKGDLVLRERHALDLKEKDLEVKGQSDGPVTWRCGLIVGPETPAKDGKFSIVLPAIPGYTLDVTSGDKILSRHTYENGSWTQIR
jgi:hypothetical protein